MRSLSSVPDECKTDDADIEVTVERVLPPLIPKGDYEMQFVRAEQRKMGRARVLKALLHFQITQAGEHCGAKLVLSMNLPANGRLVPSSKWVQHWCLAAGKRPARRDRMSTIVFRNKIFLGRVKTVETNWENRPLPPECQYSAVDCLLEVRVGALR